MSTLESLEREGFGGLVAKDSSGLVVQYRAKHPPDSPDVKCAIIEKEYRKNYLEAASKALREEL